MDVTALGSCPVVGFDINGVKTLGYTTIGQHFVFLGIALGI